MDAKEFLPFVSCRLTRYSIGPARSVASAKNDLKLIAAFYGVTIGFSAARTRKDAAPFVLALCEGAEAVIDVASNALLFGQLPSNKLLLVNVWIELHREELIASWHAGRLTGEYMKVAPLR